MKLGKLKEKVTLKPLAILLTLFLSLGILASVYADGISKTFIGQDTGEIHTLDQDGDTVIITGNGFYGTATADKQPHDGRFAGFCDGPMERWHAVFRIPFLGITVVKYIAKCVGGERDGEWYTTTQIIGPDDDPDDPSDDVYTDFEPLDEVI